MGYAVASASGSGRAIRAPAPGPAEKTKKKGNRMTTSMLLLGLSVMASLLVVGLGPRPTGARKIEQVLAGVRRQPATHFLWTRVMLLVLSAALLVMALAGPRG